MRVEELALKLLLETFADECLEEINKMKHPEVTDVFNFGLGSADAAVRRVKTKWIEKLKKQNEDYANDKIF
jgi:hypothetical protein